MLAARESSTLEPVFEGLLYSHREEHGYALAIHIDDQNVRLVFNDLGTGECVLEVTHPAVSPWRALLDSVQSPGTSPRPAPEASAPAPVTPAAPG